MNNIFQDIFNGSTVIVGVGNILRGDDALGPKLIEVLTGKVRVVCIDAGSAPENYLGKIIKLKPETILIVDAVELGRLPGSYQILSKDDIINSGFTTHDLSPKMFIDFLASQTQAKIYLLGVQPENLEFGSEISQPAAKTIEKLAGLIKEADQCTKPIS